MSVPVEAALGLAAQPACVASLPPRYREVIALFHVQHKSYAEIAVALGVPMGTVMTWLHRARKELKAQLAEHLS